ncbi:ATP-binding protein [Agromyces cerinus]|uniref:Phage shock protein C (PspC) family protein n=1 Tax=Agromyces cerinus subsp. cerinus TaxID=232089 RepID=A0A1N6GR63_9MICO|nr:ATP-binding protein [Agromyces cerinus]SIO10040.1 phage shock protein C (PspC) family protein [Agromyces cerinus subsp. cerinus]
MESRAQQVTDAAASVDADAAPSAPRLTRPRACVATGVAAGLAAHLGWPVWIVRTAFVVTSLASGAGLLLYVWLWVFTPWAPGEERPTRRAPVAWLLMVAAAISLIAAWATSGRVVESGGNGLEWWLLAVFAGVGLAVASGAWATFIDRPDADRGPRQELAIRIVATALLAITALALVFGPNANWFPVPTFVAALAAVIGIALVYVPTLIASWRDLTAERTKRIREEQRSEIAAHLHDSVLQTLALIQNRAGATSEVARIARAQERELRDWLFAGDAPAESDLGTDLRDFGAALEIDHAVTVDVVVVGESRERASGEMAAAAREAMLNAARHAGGEVSVYVESTPEAVEVFVRDRGPGFALADVPGDRLGVRESIIGRMRRAGGSGEVRQGVGGVGTEVRLRFPAAERVEVGRG